MHAYYIQYLIENIIGLVIDRAFRLLQMSCHDTRDQRPSPDPVVDLTTEHNTESMTCGVVEQNIIWVSVEAWRKRTMKLAERYTTTVEAEWNKFSIRRKHGRSVAEHPPSADTECNNIIFEVRRKCDWSVAERSPSVEAERDKLLGSVEAWWNTIQLWTRNPVLSRSIQNQKGSGLVLSRSKESIIE